MSDENVIGVCSRAVSVRRYIASSITIYLSFIPFGLFGLVLLLTLYFGPPSTIAIGLSVAFFVAGLLMILIPIASMKAMVRREQVKLTPRKILYCRRGRVEREVDLRDVEDVIVMDSSITYIGSMRDKVKYRFGRVIVLSRNGDVLLNIEIEDPHGFARAVRKLIKH
ncbi:MAG: hypothetical protein ACXQTI_08490 [Candidatus Nezhaarchaeales archaeon]